MKIIPERYECEICGNRYFDREQAEICERRLPVIYPIGMIYGNHDPKSMYANITFAVANIVIERHWNYSGSWACRDNGAGDSIGEQTCGKSGGLRLTACEYRCDPAKGLDEENEG